MDAVTVGEIHGLGRGLGREESKSKTRENGESEEMVTGVQGGTGKREVRVVR